MEQLILMSMVLVMLWFVAVWARHTITFWLKFVTVALTLGGALLWLKFLLKGD